MNNRKIGMFDYDNPSCPKCKSRDLDYDAYEPVDECFKQDISCNSCESDFTLYVFKPRYWEIFADESYFHLSKEDNT